MSAVTEEEIRSLAKLARLSLSDEEVAALQPELSSILVHMEALAELDTAGVEPMTHALPAAAALREDSVGQSLDREAVLAGSPKSDGESFVVPAILPSGGQ